MLDLSAKIRKETGSKVKALREKGILPGVLYGPKIKNILLEIDLKGFEKVYGGAGESSLINLAVDKDKFLVLIHAVEFDALSQKPIHVDLYQPNLDEEIEVAVPLVFEGESLVIKESEGTLVRNIQEVDVKALPQNLPHEIKVDISKLATFEDNILIKDLNVPVGVKILREPNEIVALAVPPEAVEEELAKPSEEKVEEVGDVKKEDKKEAGAEGEEAKEEK